MPPSRPSASSTPTPRSFARKTSSAKSPLKTFFCFARSFAPSTPRAITPFRRSSSTTCSMSSSAKRRHSDSLRPRSTGDVSRNYSTSTPPAAALLSPKPCKHRRTKMRSLHDSAARKLQLRAHARDTRTRACSATHLARHAGSARRCDRSRLLLRSRPHRHHVDGPRPARRHHLHGSKRSSPLCLLFHGADGARLLPFARIRYRIRLRRCIQPPPGSPHDRGPRHPAVDSRSELSSWRDAGHGGAFSLAPDRRRTRRNHSYLHRAGVEYRV